MNKHKASEDNNVPKKRSKKSCGDLLTLNYTEKLVEQFKRCYSEKKAFIDDETGCSLNQEPFCHCVLPNFIQEEDGLEKLEEELSNLTFKEKNNDLYKFHQSSDDLKVINTPYITELRKVIYETFKDWLHTVTGINFTDQIDMSCARYEYTDVLLCHDDELEGRRIAFIYYLVPTSWTDKHGGSLDLFSVDDKNQPDKVVKSLTPVRNNFVFFEVTPVSFHQVSEILAEESTRLSISGWFHGSSIDRPAPYVEPRIPVTPAVDVEEAEFYSWINTTYLDTQVQAEIKERFETESEIELKDFLLPKRYEELKKALQDPHILWTLKGPANKRHIYCCDMERIPQIVTECIKFLHSDAMYLILSHLTGLRLHKLYEPSDSEDSDGETPQKDLHKDEINSCCHSEVRRWKHGCYTLVHDTDTEDADYALDSVLYIGCEDWKTDFGGFTSYIAKGDDEELLSIHPKENSLALVYRDKETLCFVKHINNEINTTVNKEFFDISTVYYE